ncbi:YopX family protein [Helicobacter cinaedi]|uniref:YopX family protein n=1 Tax=Helicobacter cinaedi TaxID=213 RepID=UPI000D7C7776|nr:YopX family protein [Helicobacter cinaedi]
MKLADFDFRIWDGKQYVKNNIILAMLGRHRELININNDITRNAMFDVINSDEAEIELYTRLKDKNGKKIYEGDIVKNRDLDNLLCLYDSHNLRFVFKYICRQEYDICYTSMDTLEVLGNIHENPTLLNGGEK